jgi:hypothetical protein
MFDEWGYFCGLKNIASIGNGENRQLATGANG